MTTLFGRSWELQIDTLLIRGEFPQTAMSITFDVERTLEKKPNNASISVYNLAKETRARLQTLGNQVFVRLAVGHQGDNFTIFYGYLREVRSIKQNGCDWVTTVSSGDGERALKRARTNHSVAPGAQLDKVIQMLAADLKVGIGNASKAIKGAKAEGTGSGEFHAGTAVSGSSAREMDRLLRSAGFEWSIQDGALQVLERGKAMKGKAVKLTPQTGLIGSPEPGTKGATVCTALLMPGLVPGASVELQSQHISGFFRIDRVGYSGDSTGQVWYADLEMKALQR